MIGTGEHVGAPTSNNDRLMELLNPTAREREKRIDLNPQERIRARFRYEETGPTISVEFMRDGESLISFRLVGNALDYVGFKGFRFRLADQWLEYEDYVEFNRGDARYTHLGILDHIIADYAVDLVSRSISEKRIPEVEIPLKLAPR